MNFLKVLVSSVVFTVIVGFIFYRWIAPSLSSGVLLGIVLFIVGAILLLLGRKGSTLKKAALMMLLSGVFLTVGTVVVIFLALGSM